MNHSPDLEQVPHHQPEPTLHDLAMELLAAWEQNPECFQAVPAIQPWPGPTPPAQSQPTSLIPRDFVFFSTIGHGYLRVTRTDLVELGIVDRISRYSMLAPQFVYLEEDQDAPCFVEAAARQGWLINHIHQDLGDARPWQHERRFAWYFPFAVFPAQAG